MREQEKYYRDDVLASLRKHPGVVIKNNMVYIHRDNVGIKTLGKCDFLINYCNYMRMLCNDKQWRQL